MLDNTSIPLPEEVAKALENARTTVGVLKTEEMRLGKVVQAITRDSVKQAEILESLTIKAEKAKKDLETLQYTIDSATQRKIALDKLNSEIEETNAKSIQDTKERMDKIAESEKNRKEKEADLQLRIDIHTQNETIHAKDKQDLECKKQILKEVLTKLKWD